MVRRVLIVSWEYPPVVEGGLARHAGRLAEGLAARRAHRGPHRRAGARPVRHDHPRHRARPPRGPGAAPSAVAHPRGRGADGPDALYRIADLCVVPSLYEPFGLVALEAMASACPCIVADTGGLREVVPNEDVGLRFRASDARSLAGAMTLALAKP